LRRKRVLLELIGKSGGAPPRSIRVTKVTAAKRPPDLATSIKHGRYDDAVPKTFQSVTICHRLKRLPPRLSKQNGGCGTVIRHFSPR